MLKAKDPAPAFSLKDQNGRTHKLSDYAGKWLVLYFYPRDNTPGCTTEACAFRDQFDVFADQNVQILGISNDNVDSHARFSDRYSLPFPLLADTDKKTIKAYEAWQEKMMFGKTYLGTKRMTYLINPQGKIAKIYRTVKPASHAAQILSNLKTLQIK